MQDAATLWGPAMNRAEAWEWEPMGPFGDFEGCMDARLGFCDSDEGWRSDTWLWCLHCGRLQQVRTLRMTRGGYFLCSFGDCDGTLIDLWECDDEQNEGVFPAASERVSGASWDISETPPR